MSKKNRRKKQRRSFSWPLVVFGGILLAAAVFLFSNQGGGGGTPSIAVDQQQIDFGEVKFGVNKTFAIKVTNTGDGTLRFKENPFIEIVEGC